MPSPDQGEEEGPEQQHEVLWEGRRGRRTFLKLGQALQVRS